LLHLLRACVLQVIDLISLKPFDLETITKSIKKTRKCIIVEECMKTGGIGASLSAVINESLFNELDHEVAINPLPIDPYPSTPYPSTPCISASIVNPHAPAQVMFGSLRVPEAILVLYLALATPSALDSSCVCSTSKTCKVRWTPFAFVNALHFQSYPAPARRCFVVSAVISVHQGATL
jgi:hypothetical protein